MPHTRIFPIVLAIGLVLLLQPVFGQKRKVDVRALLGYTAGLEDTPPHAWVGGGSVTAAVGPRLRLGVEVLQANMFGKYDDSKERATLVTPVVEFEFSPGQRFNPYLVIGGGYTQYRPSNQTRYTSSIPRFLSSSGASRGASISPEDWVSGGS